MLRKFGGEGTGQEPVGNARTAALTLMSEALVCLDSDDRIPAVIGAHLQSAIDALQAGPSRDGHSVNLH